ncbi:hypothetical protein F4802DRAFT_208080 [Xylaria palmicola]|nr:hypothetical protein F4802DRAFT_208080 [Xylaria palmicola]
MEKRLGRVGGSIELSVVVGWWVVLQGGLVGAGDGEQHVEVVVLWYCDGIGGDGVWDGRPKSGQSLAHWQKKRAREKTGR